MAVIEVNNSFSRVGGLPASALGDLQKAFSYLPGGEAAVRFSRFPPKRISLVRKDGTFPTGLLAPIRKHLGANQKIACQINDLRVRPAASPGMFTLARDREPYPAQLLAASSAVLADRGGIIMPTGSGKSFVIALIIANLNVKTLVVVPSLEIKKQLQDVLLKAFGSLRHITVENIDSPSLKKHKGFDCLIIDECHHAAAKTYQNLNKTSWTGIYYRFFLSATFFRNQDNEHLLFEGIAGQPQYELSYAEAVRNKYIVPVDAYYIELPKTQVDGYTWAQVYSELVTKNEVRNKLLAELMGLLQDAGRPTLCLVKEIAHGQALSDLTGIPFVNGQDEDSRKLIGQFNDGKIKVLIGTTGVIAEGVDTRPCEYVIVAGLGKAKSAFMQAVGRAVRTYPGKETAKVIIIKDPSHKWTLAHFKAQKKILFDSYGVRLTKLAE